jgi:branched-chain amino acid aminotransferase
MAETADPFSAPFGTLFGDQITVARGGPDGYTYSGSAEPLTDLSLHPATHVLHYGSACFEGLKAHRQPDGSLAIFRLDDHVARFINSITLLRLPVPDPAVLRSMMVDAAAANAELAPPQPGALYLRPTIIGTDPNIGAAAAPSQTSLLYVLTSPVGDYFAGGIRPLSLLIETKTPRTTPQFGSIKSGANYVMALGPTLDAKAQYGVDQVLFATDGDTTETGAANFFLVDDNRLITRNLDDSFLHGITRSSIITMAADLGYTIEERSIPVDEIVDGAGELEMFLSGTAAVIAPVGTLISEGSTCTVRDGQPGPNTLRLRQALVAVQAGTAVDPHRWRTTVA